MDVGCFLVSCLRITKSVAFHAFEDLGCQNMFHARFQFPSVFILWDVKLISLRVTSSSFMFVCYLLSRCAMSFRCVAVRNGLLFLSFYRVMSVGCFPFCSSVGFNSHLLFRTLTGGTCNIRLGFRLKLTRSVSLSVFVDCTLELQWGNSTFSFWVFSAQFIFAR